MTLPTRIALTTFVGMLLVQAAWILAMPPYHAMDEFDHAYLAVGVAHGQWLPTEQTPDGRGLAVAVPPGMVDAASAQCESLAYTRPDNCRPVSERSDGSVVVATAAAGYNPLFYFVVGSVAEPFDGAAADYVMRSFSALLCALVVAAGAFCLGLMRPGPWLWLGFIASLTPMLIYTTAVPAPNSVEIVMALLTWCALLAIASGRLDHRIERRLVWVAAGAAAVSVVPRALGPLWLALIGVTLVVFVGWRRLAEIYRDHRAAVTGGVVLVVLSTVASVGWSFYAGLFGESLDVTGTASPSDLGEAMFPVVWALQIIGSFPFRNNAAPAPIYLFVLLVVVPLLVAGVRRGQGRERVAVVGAVALTLTLPIMLTLATAGSQGVIWQGRYQLAYVVGILLMCGVVLDRRPPGRLSLDALVVGSLLLTAAHVWSVVFVADLEQSRTDVPIPNPYWVSVPVWVVGALAAAGGLVLAVSAVHEMRRRLRVPAAAESTA